MRLSSEAAVGEEWSAVGGPLGVVTVKKQQPLQKGSHHQTVDTGAGRVNENVKVALVGATGF